MLSAIGLRIGPDKVAGSIAPITLQITPPNTAQLLREDEGSMKKN
jgi:hypothetical protein